MPELKCPVCGSLLQREEKRLVCEAGHSYDLARQGYVNLLMSNRSSARRHGDDRAMVLARQRFLDKGYYEPLRKTLSALACRYCPDTVELLDAGCGEGWYTSGVRQALEEAGKSCRACGVDISREALKGAHRRDPALTLAAAGVSALPVPDESCDLLLSIFAPVSEPEFYRVLRPGGLLLRAMPLEEHLMGLKRAVYEKPYLNPAPDWAPEGFVLTERAELRQTISLDDPEDIRALFMMTPYYYKTGRADQEKLFSLDRLETETAFCVLALTKQ